MLFSGTTETSLFLSENVKTSLVSSFSSFYTNRIGHPTSQNLCQHSFFCMKQPKLTSLFQIVSKLVLVLVSGVSI
jgi:hypothetical protein